MVPPVTTRDRGSIRWHRGGWELRIQIDGRRLTRRHHAPNTRAGRRAAEAALEQLARQLGAGADDATVADILTSYATARSADWSPSTRAAHAHHVRPLVDALGATPAHRLTVAAIEDLYGSWRAAGLAPTTIRRRHGILSAAMIRAERLGVIAHSPTRNVEISHPSDPADVDLPDVATVLAAISRIEGPAWLAVAARLTVATGMRRGELCALRWADVDLDASTAKISAAMSVGPDGPVRKGPKSRRKLATITLDPGTVAVLRSWRHEQQTRRLALGIGWDDHAPVIPSPTAPDAPIHPDRITRTWIRHRAQIGLPGLRWHDLRHVIASELVAAGLDPVTIAGRLGHDPAMLLGRYAHARPAADQAAADVVTRAERP